MLLVLLNALTIFLVKSYSEHPQWRSLKTFLILSMVAVVLILIITPIQYTLILGNISYSVVVLIQLIILFVQTKRLYFVLRQRKLEALSQKLSPRVIKYQKKLQGSFKYFSIFVITLLLIYYSGQWLDIFIVTVVGSVLENSCWFGHFFPNSLFNPFQLHCISTYQTVGDILTVRYPAYDEWNSSGIVHSLFIVQFLQGMDSKEDYQYPLHYC